MQQPNLVLGYSYAVVNPVAMIDILPAACRCCRVAVCRGWSANYKKKNEFLDCQCRYDETERRRRVGSVVAWFTSVSAVCYIGRPPRTQRSC